MVCWLLRPYGVGDVIEAGGLEREAGGLERETGGDCREFIC